MYYPVQMQVALFVLLGVSATTSAQAKVLTFPAQDCRLEIPDAWVVDPHPESKSKSLLHASDPGDCETVFFSTMDVSPTMSLDDFRNQQRPGTSDIKTVQATSNATIGGVPFLIIKTLTVVQHHGKETRIRDATYDTIANHRLYSLLVIDDRDVAGDEVGSNDEDLDRIPASFSFLSPPVLQDPRMVAEVKLHYPQLLQFIASLALLLVIALQLYRSKRPRT